MYHLLTANVRMRTKINILHINLVKKKSLDFVDV